MDYILNNIQWFSLLLLAIVDFVRVFVRWLKNNKEAKKISEILRGKKKMIDRLEDKKLVIYDLKITTYVSPEDTEQEDHVKVINAHSFINNELDSKIWLKDYYNTLTQIQHNSKINEEIELLEDTIVEYNCILRKEK